ncbi:MAG: hypothetical protein CSA79_02395 [Thiothrix nivea]|nr:MAG: hypothetical protein CSA79_02395 [Thiothrix nivea]
MSPDQIIYQVRQRSEWEAIDMGFRLIQHTWRHILPAWLLLILPLTAGLLFVIPEDYIFIAGILLWWLKPLYDRLLLYMLSRNLFAEHPSSAETFSALPGLMKNTGLFSALTWRRFSFSRSYNLPLWQLEGLRGTTLKERKELIYLQGHSQAVALTISCRLLEIIVIFSLLALVLLFDPTGQVWEHWKALFTNTSGSDMEYLLSLADIITQVIAIIIIEPFFVAAGFTLYLNRRTRLEAWDIELAFRSLGKRLQKQTTRHRAPAPILTLFITACIALVMLQPAPLQAAEEDEILSPQRLSVEQSETVLEAVMAVDELNGRRQITTWMPRDKNKTDDRFELDEHIIQLISHILKILLWAAVMVALLLAFIYRRRILEMLKPVSRSQVTTEKPDVLFGMDIRPESLPDDIAAAARRHWQQGEHRAALSLLYRGALMQLTRHDALTIADSHTEGDILQLARPVLPAPRFVWLREMTAAWRSVAYAHRLPADATAEQLFNGWEPFAAVQTATTPAPEPGTGQTEAA